MADAVQTKAGESRRKYKTGTRAEILQRMAYHAIRDQVALIDAHIPSLGEPNESALAVIEDCRKNIADYKRLSKALL